MQAYFGERVDFDQVIQTRKRLGERIKKRHPKDREYLLSRQLILIITHEHAKSASTAGQPDLKLH